MLYDAIRHRIKSGDLIALTHTGWSTFYDWQVQAVRVATRSEYAHIAQAWVIGGRVFVLESVTPLVRMVPLSLFAKEGFYWIPLKKPMSPAELEHALALIGTGRYSKWEAVKAFFGRLKPNGLWECAKYVIANRALSGVNLGEEATPTAVVRAAQELGCPISFVRKST